MEVHHHPDLHHKRKKFREYLLEFVMIFLAVTLGFLAENIREHISDKEKEREYISSLLGNLKEDTAGIDKVISDNEHKRDTLRLLLALARENINDTGTRRKLYFYVSKFVGFYSYFRANDATMTQLKNSGGLRYIRRDHVADSIAAYDVQLNGYIYGAQDIYIRGAMESSLAAQETVEYAIYSDGTYWDGGRHAGDLLPLLTEDPHRLQWFFNKIDYDLSTTNNYINQLRRMRPFVIRLIRFLQAEYDLE